MVQVLWDWKFFLVGLFTLILIQFIQEYKEHKNINFTHFKNYTKVFWFFNSTYVILGAIFTTLIGMSLKPDSLLAAVIYAGGWEGIFGSLISNKLNGVQK